MPSSRWALSPSLRSSTSDQTPTKRPSLIAGASTFAAVPGYDPPTVRQHRTTSWPASFVTRSGKLAALDALGAALPLRRRLAVGLHAELSEGLGQRLLKSKQ